MSVNYRELKNQLESSTGPDAFLESVLWKLLNEKRPMKGEMPPFTSSVEKTLQLTEDFLPGFVYLMWRDGAGQHHVSLALDDHDLDIHAWRGKGASPALAWSAALLSALSTPVDRSCAQAASCGSASP